jgi:hypothetical protein
MSEVRVTIATFQHAVDAAKARARLQQAGIKSFVAGQPTLGAAQEPPAGIFGLQVAALDAPEALHLLDDLMGAGSRPSFKEPLARDPAEEAPLSARSQAARRAFRAAVIGLLFAPVELYASWLLLKVVCSREQLDARPRRQAVIAACLNLGLYGVIVLILFSPLINPFPNEVNPLHFAHPPQMAGIWVRDDGATEIRLWASGKMHYRDLEEPRCEFSGTWGLADFQFLFNVRRLSTPGRGFEQGRSYSWPIDHFTEHEMSFHDALGIWKYVRKKAKS